MLWEVEQPDMHMLIQNATTLSREVVQRCFPDWNAFAEENQRLWTTYYLLWQPCDHTEG